MDDDVVSKQHLVSETKTVGAIFRTYATLLQPEDGPVGLQFSTTYSKAKNPDEHRIQHTVFFETDDQADEFLDFLVKNL